MFVTCRSLVAGLLEACDSFPLPNTHSDHICSRLSLLRLKGLAAL